MLHTIITAIPGPPNPLFPPRLAQVLADSKAEAIDAAIGEHRVSLIDILGPSEASTQEIVVAVHKTGAPQVGTALPVSGAFTPPRVRGKGKGRGRSSRTAA